MVKNLLGFFARLLGLLFIAATGISSAQAWQYDGYNTFYAPPPAYFNPGYRLPPPTYYAPYPYPDYRYQGPPPAGYAGFADQGRATEIPAINQRPRNARPEPAQDIDTLKQRFVERLLPPIRQENIRLGNLRSRLIKEVQLLNAGYDITPQAREWLQQLAREYRVGNNPLQSRRARDELVKRVDIVPASLTLAQAANESAWGRSRFAKEANNLFGIWTFDADKGLAPQQRDADKNHLVRKFEHAGESIRYYMHTLNTHSAYTMLRDIRARARAQKLTPNGMDMAQGLEKYSAKGKEYIALIQQLIRQNQWAGLDRVQPG